MAVLAVPAAARAQSQVEFIPSMSMFAVYDDNVFARVEGSAGQMLQVRPSMEGSYESPTVRLVGVYSFDMQRSNFATLNTLDARRHALGESRVRLSPFTTLGLALRYDRSETPGELELESGLLGDRRTAERAELTPTFARRLTPRTVLTGGYNWTTEHLIDGERGTMQAGRVSWSREISTLTTLTGSYVGRHFADYSVGDAHTSHALLGGWNRELAPGTRVNLSAGPRITTYRGLAPEVSASFARNTNRTRTALDYWHGETIVLGVQGPVAIDSVTSRLTWPLTRRLELGTHAGFSDVVTLDDRRTAIYRGGLVGSWSPGGMYTIAATYGLDFQTGTIRNPIFLDDMELRFDDDVLRHVFRVSVTVAPRYKRSILPSDEAARANGVTR